MALHPDDPPYPIFGLPRVITCEKNIDRYLSIVDSPSNALCLRTGSLGSVPSNDIPYLTRKYASRNRIGFMHLRNVRILENGSFEEAGHLSQNGSVDMNAIVKALVDCGFDGYFRPDHGRMIWDEVDSGARAGYGLYDRALGSAYLNGLIEANGGTSTTAWQESVIVCPRSITVERGSILCLHHSGKYHFLSEISP